MSAYGRSVDLLLPEAGPVAAVDLLGLYDAPAPYVRAGMVLSVDGAAERDGGSRALQAPGDLEVLLALRAVADVVLVGAGTARAEGYRGVTLAPTARAWRAAQARGPAVPLAVVTRSGALPAGLQAAYVVTCGAADTRPGGAEVLVCGDDEVDLPEAVRQLADRGHPRVLCEGGPSLLGDLVRAGLLTEVCATLSPLLAGAAPGLLGGALADPVPLVLAHLLREQSTLLGRWRVA